LSFYHECRQSDYPWSEESLPQLHLHPAPMPTQRQAMYFPEHQKTHPDELQSEVYLKLDDLQIKKGIENAPTQTIFLQSINNP